MPSVGSVSFDTMRGLPQSPLNPNQVAAVIDATLNIGFKEGQKPRQDSVELITQIDLATEAASIALAKAARALVGTIQTVTVDTGVTVARQYVQSVDCQWKQVKGSAGTRFLFTATWQVIATYQETDSEQNRSYASVYTGTKFGSWTSQPKLRCFSASEGLGSYAGECELMQLIGTVQDVPADEVDVVGKWVEIRAKSDSASPKLPVWWGFCKEKSLSRLSSGSVATYRCIGLVDALRTIYPTRWYERTAAGLIDPGSMLPFSPIPKGDKRSTNDQAITNSGRTDLYVHERAWNRTLGGIHTWKAIEILETVLAGITGEAVSLDAGPTWALAGQTECLNYEFSGNLAGMSVFEIVQTLISPTRGMTFSVRPALTGGGNQSSSTARFQIYVYSTVPHKSLIQGFGVTDIIFPGSSRSTSFDLSDKNVTDWSLNEDHSEVFDQIYVEATKRPVHSTTVMYTAGEEAHPAAPGGTCQLTTNWTGPQLTAWLSGDTARRNQSDVINVNRSFILKTDWQGAAHKANAGQYVPIIRESNDGNETGKFAGDYSADWPDGSSITLSKSLPYPEIPVAPTDGFAGLQSLIGAGQLDMSKPNAKCQAYKVAGANWYNLNFDFDITTGADSSTITIGKDSNDAMEVQRILSAGYKLAFTIAYELPKTWRMSWRRSLRPKDCARTLWIKLSGTGYEWRVMDAGTVYQLNVKTPVYANAHTDIAKPGNIQQALDLAKLRYTKPKVSASWTLDGSLDLSTWNRPGALVTSLKVPYGRRDPRVQTVNTILVRREWIFAAESPKTKYLAEPSLTDIPGVSEMRGNAVPVGGGGGAGGGLSFTRGG